MNPTEPIKTKDAVNNHWVNTFAPDSFRPFLRLARADRPIGTWLLLWPCWWSIALANTTSNFPDLWLLALFAIGAFVMRGAGCTLNDIVDRNFDGMVERTALRPIPAGEVTLLQAFIFMGFLCLVGFAVLVELNQFTIILGVSSLSLIVIYPFMKRITYWPQLVLGLTFNWGALMGWTAVTGSLDTAPIALYVAGIFWTLGYDTIYAHQDKDDDILIGVKSTALKLGNKTKSWLVFFYTSALWLFAFAGLNAGGGMIFVCAMVLMAAQLFWQVKTVKIKDSENCLAVFKSNTNAGWILFLGLIADKMYNIPL
jgi:4-hydroxybenzoate polyprenyltransferase